MSHPLLRSTEHRPWALPKRSWLWYQNWDSVLLLHYRVDRERLARLIPRELPIELIDGSAWVSVVPFRMRRVRPRGLPSVQAVSDFAELNVRTYVCRNDRPGVYFLRIQAEKRLAAWLARELSHLPYEHASMSFVRHGAGVSFTSPSLVADWTPRAPRENALADATDLALTERYCLYTTSPRGLLRADVHHVRWPLQNVRLRIERNTLLHELGVADPTLPDRVHLSPGVEVMAWSAEKVSG